MSNTLRLVFQSHSTHCELSEHEISLTFYSKSTHDRNGHVVRRPEGFFHRVGRWILTGILIFFGLLFILILFWYMTPTPNNSSFLLQR